MSNVGLKTDQASFDAPVDTIRGVSTRRAEAYARLGVKTLGDLIYHLPRDYEDWSEITPIQELVPGVAQTIFATIDNVGNLNRRGKLTWITIEVSDASGRMSLTFFHMPWLQKKFRKGQRYYFHGKVEQRGFFMNLVNPLFMTPAEWDEQKFFPVYPLSEGLSQKMVREHIAMLLDHPQLALEQLVDPLPKDLRNRYHLADLSFAIRRIHTPRQREDLDIAKRRLAFEELFLTRAALKLLKERRLSLEHAPVIDLDDAGKRAFQDFLDSLPFTPTNAQIRASNDAFRDMRRDRPMNRLLQGDVGSGKTLVATLAMLYAVLSGRQALFMAPTSILAMQHTETIQNFLKDTDLRVELLSGGMPKKQREQLKADLLAGDIDILIGTHAVLQDDIVFRDLGLAVTDEQHRFGVKQRSLVQGTGEQKQHPHRLVMSATPIPRTLALILYGDLDVSILDERPKGRGELLTYTVTSKDASRVYDLLRDELDKGRQIYVVCPLIEEGETDNVESATEVYEKYTRGPFRDYRLALLHGGLKQEEKDGILLDFLNGKIDLLVSTTVIEVGIDNPNATVMLILNAERFGLAQLHQLRGRIGRGEHRSLCLLQSDVGEGLARERLRTLCHEDDGFKIAEADLKLRGPGQFFGTKQHGLGDFRVANLYRDKELLDEVDRAIQTESLDDPDLRAALERRFPELEHGETL